MFFYDPSVVDGTDEDDAARALRDAEETSCCATCFLIDVRKHMVSQKKTKLHDTSSSSSTTTKTRTPVQSAVECLDTFLKNRIISSPNDKVSEKPQRPPRNRMSRCSTTTTTHKYKNGRTDEPWLLTLSFFFCLN